MYAISVLPYIFPLLVYVKTQEKNSDNKYCSLCLKPGTHTMCLYPEKGPGKLCKGYSIRMIDDREKELILHYHNYYRNKVALGYAENEYGHQPPAAGMLQVVWHNELQEIAQRWADQCTSFEDSAQHDACKMTEEFEVGQNIITIGTPSSKVMNFSEAIKDWYQEMVDYDPDWVDSYKGSVKPPKKIGHYTQLVWAKTQYVGCASVTFLDVVRRKKFWVNRLVCDYGPSGNIIDATVYKVGRPCSKCPSGTTCSPHWAGLCASREQRAAPPALPVEFSEPAVWVQKKYRPPAWNQEVSIPAYPRATLRNPKRVTRKITSLSTTKKQTLFTSTPSLHSTVSPTRTSLTPSTTSPSPSVSSSLTSSPPLNAPTTSNATSLTATKTRGPSSQSSPPFPTQQPTTTSSRKPTHKRLTSSTTKGKSITFRRSEIIEVQERSFDVYDETTTSGSSSWSQGPGAQSARSFLPRTVFQRWRRRWRGRVCLCPVSNDEDGEDQEDAFAKVNGVGKKPVRSPAGAAVPSAALVLSALAVMRVLTARCFSRRNMCKVCQLQRHEL